MSHASSNAACSDRWHGLLARHSRKTRPWLILPRAPVKSNDHDAISYAELWDQAARIARLLRDKGAGTGDRVIVVANNSAPSCMFILGVLLAGCVLVPIAPPSLWQRREIWESTLQRIRTECEPRLLLVPAKKDLASCVLPADLGICDFGDVSSMRLTSQAIAIPPGDIALIQYTSGTTEHPRGVALTHSNLLRSIQSIGEAFRAGSEDVAVTWLPMYHDMGLIGTFLFSFVWGMPTVLMPSTSFGIRPESWLWALSRFGGTCCAAPNSAYHLYAEKIPLHRLSGLDLSRWRIAFNGAELIHPDTLRVFEQRSIEHGCASNIMFPVYGLAENTVAATLPDYKSRPRIDHVDHTTLEYRGRAVGVEPAAPGAREFVAVGRSMPDQELRIVDCETSRAVGDRCVGEIQIRGPYTMRGYFQRNPNDGFTSDGWLRTGDRGYLADGELFVVGRYKHLIKRRGQDVNGSLVENAVRFLPEIGAAAVAVFGLSDADRGSELLVMMVETTRMSPDEHASMRRLIGDTLRATMLPLPDTIAFVSPGTIPRTSSGKTRHGDARDVFLNMKA